MDGRAVPLLPGTEFHDISRQHWGKQMSFEFKNGQPFVRTNPADGRSPSRAGMVSQASLRSESRASSGSRMGSAAAGEFVPSFASLDGKVCVAAVWCLRMAS